METEIRVHAKSNPDSLDIESCRKFDLSFSVDVVSGQNLAKLSDGEIYALIYPLALEKITAAMSQITVNTKSKIDRVIPHDRPMIDLHSKFTRNTGSEDRFEQHHDIEGFVMTDAHVPVNTGEAWLIGQHEAAKGAAQNVVTNVLRGLGRDSVSITPAMMNGSTGAKIDTYQRPSSQRD